MIRAFTILCQPFRHLTHHKAHVLSTDIIGMNRERQSPLQCTVQIWRVQKFTRLGVSRKLQ